MPYKDKEKQLASQRRHYRNHKEIYILKNQKLRKQLKEKINNIKSKTPCTDCGILYPFYVTDFDHINTNKKANISTLVNNMSPRLVEIELTKCELVCSNCHRERTYKRQHY
jgi:hypothetical protein